MSYSNKFYKSIYLPVTVYRVLKNIAFQRKFLEENIAPFTKNAFDKNDGSLGPVDNEKIYQYYGLAVPAILGEAFCALRGKEMSFNERWASTCQGAMTGLFDDFFDKDYMSDTGIENLIEGKADHSPKRSNQHLFDTFYKNALKYVPDPATMQQELKQVYKAQVESKKQEQEHISAEELLDITFFKGGSSLIFYRTAFTPAATAEEIKILYGLGGIMQLSNDIFDVYKDREAGIKTLITETTGIAEIKRLYKDQLNEYCKNAFEAGFPAGNVRTFLNIISIGIFSRCFVCLGHLEKNERTTGNKFRVHEYSRKQLICDMDKKTNMLRSALYHISDMP